MLLEINWNIDPEIFRIGGFGFRYYTLMFLLAFYSSYKIMQVYFRQKGLDEELLDKLTVYIILATIIGARLGHCLFYEFEYYSKHPWEMLLPFRTVNGETHFTGFMGLASHGGGIGIMLAVWMYSRRFNINLLWLVDRLSVVVALSGFFIRMGNLFNSEIIGRPTDVPWAFVFHKEDLIPRHPGQLYEAIAYLLIFLLLYQLNKRKEVYFKPGFLFGLLLVLVFTARFVLEYFKENQESFEDSMVLNMGQILSIPMILLGLFFLFRKPSSFSSKTDRPKKKPYHTKL